jgi:hypothetical protein
MPVGRGTPGTSASACGATPPREQRHQFAGLYGFDVEIKVIAKLPPA